MTLGGGICRRERNRGKTLEIALDAQDAPRRQRHFGARGGLGAKGPEGRHGCSRLQVGGPDTEIDLVQGEGGHANRQEDFLIPMSIFESYSS